MRQRSTSPASVLLAKGLSARASKLDVTTQITRDEDPQLIPPVSVIIDAQPRAPARFERGKFYLKIDGLTGPRPKLRNDL
ncbi:hypothetical protein [Asticcacaulis sp. AC402]|uniref:hypothetical protein n=1 Tax=Asticcacaulis sp. AC402 TaxID=1282361 RepID=UPI0003C410C3|nr:hypothetical protein [Asticcacaulis sp. AC402]ESQ76011.1 hypothetical protein ABAC402_06085 [Asticcacaulis sp. AC402]